MAGELIKRIGNVTVRAREGDHFVNATELAKAADKRWVDYARLDGTKEFLNELRGSVGIPTDLDLVQSITTGPNDGRGTWVHPQVAIDFARWASPKFAVAISGWVLELVTTGKVELPVPVPQPPADLVALARAAAAEAISDLLANQGRGPRLSGPFWTVAAWLEENMPEWEVSAKQRHAIGQDAKRRVTRACPQEQVGYFNRDLAFQAHQVYYLSVAAQKARQRAEREGRAKLASRLPGMDGKDDAGEPAAGPRVFVGATA
jgi:hypothetical protein